MKKFVLLLSLALLASIAYSKEYLVGTEGNYPPYNFLDTDGRMVGLDIDVLTAAADVVGIKLRFLSTPWVDQSWIKTLNDDSRDIWASGIAINDERAKLVTYTDSYYSTRTVIFVRTDNLRTENASTLDDMRNVVIASQKNTVDYRFVKEFFADSDNVSECQNSANDNLVGTDTQFLALKGLLQGKYDAVIGNISVGLFLTKPFLEKSRIQLRHFDAPSDEIRLGFAVKKGNLALAKKINRGLKTIRENGTYDKILKKWLN